MPNEGAGFDITVTGLTQLKKELSVLAPDLKNQLAKVFRDSAKKVRDDARSKVPSAPPLSHWRTVKSVNGTSRGGAGWPHWDAAQIRAGIEYKAGVTAPGFTSKSTTKFFGYRVYNASAAGNILEVSKHAQSKSGQSFIAGLNQEVGKTGRLIYGAFDKNETEINSKIRREVDRIMTEYDRRLNATK
ncbi:hypothetical protein UFOVP1608_21 [uncultured Caudovirales phage]|uniref:Uncharacterized protein n=1 Tax=uncultured Caudovirales phage TaxID=2100421 RepID=A0A6J5SSP2_9CAUD|nr:hypothetical protein UFOVP1608_21 [uncultured Caudovirales phage]